MDFARENGLPVQAAPGGVLAPDEIIQINFRGLLQSTYDDDDDGFCSILVKYFYLLPLLPCTQMICKVMLVMIRHR